MAKADGSVTILNVERLPFYVKEFHALLPEPILQVRTDISVYILTGLGTWSIDIYYYNNPRLVIAQLYHYSNLVL